MSHLSPSYEAEVHSLNRSQAHLDTDIGTVHDPVCPLGAAAACGAVYGLISGLSRWPAYYWQNGEVARMIIEWDQTFEGDSTGPGILGNVKALLKIHSRIVNLGSIYSARSAKRGVSNLGS